MVFYFLGNFLTVQCHGAAGSCWCMDASGTELPKSRVGRGQFPDCDVAIAQTNNGNTPETASRTTTARPLPVTAAPKPETTEIPVLLTKKVPKGQLEQTFSSSIIRHGIITRQTPFDWQYYSTQCRSKFIKILKPYAPSEDACLCHLHILDVIKWRVLTSNGKTT